MRLWSQFHIFELNDSPFFSATCELGCLDFVEGSFECVAVCCSVLHFVYEALCTLYRALLNISRVI